MVLCIVLARAKIEPWLGWGPWQGRRHVNWDLKNDRNSSSVGEEKAGWVGGVGGLAASTRSYWCDIV